MASKQEKVGTVKMSAFDLKNTKPDFKHFDKTTHSIQEILFNKKDELPFHKSIFMQNLIKENS